MKFKIINLPDKKFSEIHMLVYEKLKQTTGSAWVKNGMQADQIKVCHNHSLTFRKIFY